MNRSFSIIHLSDLHFGRIHPEILRDLDEFMLKRSDEIKLAIVTGDLTQRAKKSEFLQAKEFMTSLKSPLFVVPGNHDVPLYNLFLRFLSPYKKFLRYLGPFAQNYFEDDDVAVYGLWTTDHFTIQSGRMSKKDINNMTEKFTAVPVHKMKIIACHHPIEDDKNLHSALALKPDLILWGHEHQSRIIHQGKTIMLASGTSTSTRTRTEANSFNYISVNEKGYEIEVYRHSKMLKAFEVIDRKTVNAS